MMTQGRSRHWFVVGIWAASTAAIGCGTQTEPHLGQTREGLSAATVKVSLAIPSSVSLARIALQTGSSGTIADAVAVEPSSTNYAEVVNTGTDTLEVGADAVLGSPKGSAARVSLTSFGRIWLRERAYVAGSAVSAKAIDKQNNVTVLGSSLANQALPAPRILSWRPRVPPRRL